MVQVRFADVFAILAAVSPFGAPSVPVLEKTTEKGLDYAIYLPPNLNPTQSYNLLVHLHGAASPYFFMIRELRLTGELLEQHSVDNLIVLAPHDATKWSLWVNGDTIDMATQVFDELIPQIKREYNIQKQFLQGFSMGGFGAAVHGHRFDSTVVWDGALHDWESLENPIFNTSLSGPTLQSIPTRGHLQPSHFSLVDLFPVQKLGVKNGTNTCSHNQQWNMSLYQPHCHIRTDRLRWNILTRPWHYGIN